VGRELKNRLTNGILERHLRDAAKAHARGRLIDIGCGEKPYARLMRPFVREHVGVDHVETLHDTSNVDLFGTAYAIPSPDGAFDTALCTAVLEHLEEPQAALEECFRVLTPGGVAIYSVPFIWHIHEAPRDFYRYTEFGLRYLFEKAGFEILQLTPLSGFWVTGGQMLAYYLDRANKGILRTFRILDVIVLAIQGVAALLERLDRPTRWTWMYLVVARRPARDSEPRPA
jgi:ubiquinone/menaquinone biosynthesis C-methylase UbiE